MDHLIKKIYSTAVAKKNTTIGLFKISYLGFLFFFVVGGYSIAQQNQYAPFFYQIGLLLGKLALLTFIIILVPGIVKRFGIKHEFISLVRIFRRYLGIFMFLCAFIHASFVRLIAYLLGRLTFQPGQFELFGIAALVITFFLFISANDWSVERLGLWWYRLHRLIYVIMWLIFIHVGLQRISIWTVLMGLTLLFEIASFMAQFQKASS